MANLCAWEYILVKYMVVYKGRRAGERERAPISVLCGERAARYSNNAVNTHTYTPVYMDECKERVSEYAVYIFSLCDD